MSSGSVGLGDGGGGVFGGVGAMSSSMSASSSLSLTVPLGPGAPGSFELKSGSRCDVSCSQLSKLPLSSATHSVMPTKSKAFMIRTLSSTCTACPFSSPPFVRSCNPHTRRLCNLLTSKEFVVSTIVASHRDDKSR